MARPGARASAAAAGGGEDLEAYQSGAEVAALAGGDWSAAARSAEAEIKQLAVLVPLLRRQKDQVGNARFDGEPLRAKM